MPRVMPVDGVAVYQISSNIIMVLTCYVVEMRFCMGVRGSGAAFGSSAMLFALPA